MNNVNVVFSSIHKHESEIDEINFEVIGTLEHDVDYNKLTYVDNSSGDIVTCVVTFNDNEIHIIRNGGILNEMNFYKKQKSFGFYEINDFSIPLTIVLKDLIIKEKTLKIDYDLLVESHNSGFFSIKIVIEEIENGNS